MSTHERASGIHELFTEQARRTPDVLALTGGDTEYTYAQLDALTDRLAAQLCARGVRAECIVGCWLF
jgi:iturin family lipopeptide synthetase B